MISFLKKIFHLVVAIGSYYFYGMPAKKMIVIGVTGTKGKTTTCRMIASVLAAKGDKVGMLTTAEIQIGDELLDNQKKMTMLGRGQTQKLLRQMLKKGCCYAVVETSSQGILQYRHFGLHYDAMVFTNLAPEHIEAHGGFENYKQAKGRVFATLTSGYRKMFDGKKIRKISLINSDDDYAPYFLSFDTDKAFTFSLNDPGSDLLGIVKSSDKEKVVFMADNYEFILPFSGDFNIYNALPAILLGREYGFQYSEIAHGLLNTHSPAGRMQMVDAGQDFTVIVDFAHETLSYQRLFGALRPLTPGRLICIIGADGGGRDVGKRPKMGEIAGRLTDVVFVSDVNPYDEDPMEVINQVAGGVRQAGKRDGKDLFIEPNRRQAIVSAFSMARAGDTVALVGKGNEKYIIRAHGEKEAWDDVVVAREEIKNLNF